MGPVLSGFFRMFSMFIRTALREKLLEACAACKREVHQLASLPLTLALPLPDLLHLIKK